MSFDKSAVNLLGFPFYVNPFFHLAACSLLSLSFVTLITMCLESFLFGSFLAYSSTLGKSWLCVLELLISHKILPVLQGLQQVLYYSTKLIPYDLGLLFIYFQSFFVFQYFLEVSFIPSYSTLIFFLSYCHSAVQAIYWIFYSAYQILFFFQPGFNPGLFPTKFLSPVTSDCSFLISALISTCTIVTLSSLNSCITLLLLSSLRS